MPTYEYACRDCDHHLEVVQSFRDDPLAVCPNCDGRLRKVFSAAGIIFKGSGWHIKDYGTSRSAGAAGTSSDGSGSDSSESADSSTASSSSDSSSGSSSSDSGSGDSSTEAKSA